MLRHRPRQCKNLFSLSRMRAKSFSRTKKKNNHQNGHGRSIAPSPFIVSNRLSFPDINRVTTSRTSSNILILLTLYGRHFLERHFSLSLGHTLCIDNEPAKVSRTLSFSYQLTRGGICNGMAWRCASRLVSEVLRRPLSCQGVITPFRWHTVSPSFLRTKELRLTNRES